MLKKINSSTLRGLSASMPAVVFGLFMSARAVVGVSCDCNLPEIPVCTSSTKPGALSLLNYSGNDQQLQALKALTSFNYSIRLSQGRERNILRRKIDTALGKPLHQINPIGLGRPGNPDGQKLLAARAGLAVHHDELMMKYPGEWGSGLGQPISSNLANGDLAYDPVKRCVRHAALGDHFPDKTTGQSNLLVGTAFPEVGRILHREHLDSTKVGICSFVLISLKCAVTALHCLLDTNISAEGPKIRDDLSQGGPHSIRFFMSPNGEDPDRRLLDCFDDSKVGTPACPFQRVHVAKAVAPMPIKFVGNATKPLPVRDLALLQLKAPFPPNMVFAKWGHTPVEKGRKTLVAVGATTAEAFTVGYQLQVGDIGSGTFIKGPDGVARQYVWKIGPSAPGSAVCAGDSGGAIFDGREDGLCRCQNKQPVLHQRSLLGVVSYYNEEKAGVDGECPIESKSSAIVLADYREWICQQAPDLEACKAP